MMKYEKIGVFLSANSQVDDICHQAVREVGEWIGRTRRTLIYGGAKKGLMEELAQATKQNGGRIFGVVPEIVVNRNLVSETLDVTIRTVDLADRKSIIIEKSDILLALPGGVGTLDEVFTALSMASIGYPSKRVVLYNPHGFWNSLLDLLADLHHKGMLRDSPQDLLSVVGNLEELQQLLDGE